MPHKHYCRIGAASELAQRIFDDAFDVPRDPRSDEYKAGVLAALNYRIDGVAIPRLFKPGTAQDDAYYAGISAGHSRWRESQNAA